MWKAWKVVLIIVATALSFGCTTAQKMAFVPTNRMLTQEDFYRDRYRCVQEAQTSWAALGNPWMMAMVANAQNKRSQQLFTMCMEAAGWTLQPVR